MTLRADIVVVGAGVVGACAALLLSRLGADVLVLERREPAAAPSADSGGLGADLRTLALSPASLALLADAGLDPGPWQDAGASYTAMEVWDAEGTGCLRFRAAEAGLSELGRILPHEPLALALWQTLEAEGVRCLTGRALEGLQAQVDGCRLQLDDGSCIEAALVVGADGGASKVRSLAGIEVDEQDTGQRAIATLAALAQPHQATAWQRFLPSGPLAFLPLPDQAGQHVVSVVWSLQTDAARELEALDDEAFATALGAAMEHRFGAVTRVARRLSFPLRQIHARCYRAPGVVLLGDAAHVLHPLAGQGVNLGLQDVRVLVAELRRHLRGPGRALLGQPDLLHHYERIRRGENAIMLRAMDALKRLFASDDIAVRYLRNEGLRQVGEQGFIKRLFLRQALGLDALAAAGEPA